MARAYAQGLGQKRAFPRLFAQQDERGRRARVVELGQKRGEQLAILDIRRVAREERPVAPVLPGAEEEHLNAGLRAFPVQREHIGLGEAGRVDALARVNLAHGADAVAQLRRALELRGFGGVRCISAASCSCTMRLLPVRKFFAWPTSAA